MLAFPRRRESVSFPGDLWCIIVLPYALSVSLFLFRSKSVLRSISFMNIGTKQLQDLVCEHCKALVPDTSDTCFTCGQPVGAPNVRSANKAEEKRALESRYSNVFDDAAANGTRDRLKDFSRKMGVTCAVFNVDISFLYTSLQMKKRSTLATAWA